VTPERVAASTNTIYITHHSIPPLKGNGHKRDQPWIVRWEISKTGNKPGDGVDVQAKKGDVFVWKCLTETNFYIVARTDDWYAPTNGWKSVPYMCSDCAAAMTLNGVIVLTNRATFERTNGHYQIVIPHESQRKGPPDKDPIADNPYDYDLADATVTY
jgi:hypothetical protein